jgi:hypothetical protein
MQGSPPFGGLFLYSGQKCLFCPFLAAAAAGGPFSLHDLFISANPNACPLVKNAQKGGANFHVLRRGLRLSFLENDGMIYVHGELGGALSRPLCNI